MVVCIILSSILIGITTLNLLFQFKKQKYLKCDCDTCSLDCPRESNSGPRLRV